MIAGIFHKGSGLGNQLHRYVATRCLALDKGYEFSMVAPELFKGKEFMNLDVGVPPPVIAYQVEINTGKTIFDNPNLWEEWNKYCYDPDFNFVEDNTVIDGNFEDERYFEHRFREINSWLKVEPIEIPGDLCVIGFRGGEYYSVPELGLPKSWYDNAVEKMLEINPKMRFEIHTDDPELAEQFFGQGVKIIKDIGLNWRSMRYAKYAIIANSSFYVLPRLLKHHVDKVKFENGGAPDIRPLFALTLAPRWWNRYNTRQWDYPQNYYKQFKYIV